MPFTQCRNRDEQGVVVVLTAMLLFAIIMMAALALDFSQMAVGTEQGTNTARFAALSALQAYSSASTDKTITERIAIATQHANNVAGMNLNLTYGGKNSAETLNEDGSGTTQLVAGKYYAEAPVSLCSNPCTTGQTPPCFVPLADVKSACEPEGTTTYEPNSFRVVGKYFSDMRTIFARVMGKGTYSVNVDTIAAFTPRRGMFLVDISASSFQDTHWYDKEAPEYPSFYSYYLQPDNAGSPSTYFDNTLPGSWSQMNADRSSPPAGAPASTDPEYATLHYKSDYAIVTTADPMPPAPNPYTGDTAATLRILQDADYPLDSEYAEHHPDPSNAPAGVNYHSNQHEGTFRVDTFRDDNYLGPEPFNTVFKGLDSAVEAFRERAVTGDRLGIVFFDKNIIWPRVINLTSDFNYIKTFTDVSVTDKADKGLQKVLRHGIFPSLDSMSNVQMALMEALRQFDNVQGTTASSVDFMVYFGDGLANCVVDVNAIGTGAPPCANDVEYYLQAMKELRVFAVNTLYPRRISFNAILVGSSVGPHVLALRNEDGECMEDVDARNAEKKFVRGLTNLPAVPPKGSAGYDAIIAQWRNAYNNMGTAQPFYQVNEDLYRIARATGGIWGPLRTFTTDQTLCKPTCTSDDPALAPRITHSCDNTTTDIDRYIREQIMNANPYMIVPGSTSGS